MALSWLVYRLTNSALMLGVIGFTSQAPALLLTPFAGIIIDRSNRHYLIIITQTLAMLQAGLLTLVAWSQQPALAFLILLSAMLGVITAFDMPTRQTFLVDMLDDKEELPKAIGINSSINTITRLLGPFLAGLLIAWAGEKICFLINTISYFAVIGALLFIKIKRTHIKPVKKHAIAELKEGFFYILQSGLIRDLILFLALVALFAMPFAVLMPIFARDIFHGNAMTMGFLGGALGFGSVAGALFLTTRAGTKDLSKWIILGCVSFGISLVIFGLSKYFFLSLLALVTIGFGSMILIAGSNTIIQTVVDHDKRGRVMSFFVMAFLGLSPIGAASGGFIANIIGADKTVLISGIFTLALAAIFGRRILNIHVQASELEKQEGLLEAESEMKAVNI